MADATATHSMPTEKSHMTLHVVSPSTQRITFENIPILTTVLELKTKLSESSPTRPPVHTQRLIYQGHPVAQGEKTLRDIFTQQKINETDSLTLHLVTPPSHSASTLLPQPQAHTTHNPPPPNSPHAPPPPVGTPQGVQFQGTSLHGSNGQSQLPVNVGQPGHTLGQLPPNLQQSFVQFQAIQAQLAAQLASLHNHPIMNGQIAHHQVPTAQAPMYPLPQPTPQRDSQHQQQQNSAASNHPNQNATPHPQQYGATTAQTNLPLQPQLPQALAPPNSNTVYREHIGPNGQRWSTVTHTGTMNFSTPLHYHRHPGAGQGGQSHFNRQSPRSGIPSDQAAPTLAGSTSPLVANNPTTSNTNGPDNTYPAQDRTPHQRAQHGDDNSTVYVLSSPSGPHALLVTPSGSYTAPWHIPIAPNLANNPTSTGLPNQMNVLGASGLPICPTQQPAAQAVNPQEAHLQQAQQMQLVQMPNRANAEGQDGIDQQQQQQQQARDLARILLPMAGHMWLFVRLFGFVWFFTHGASWTRTILLCLIATLVFIGQSGFFRPVLQGFWDPIRQHAENLFPLAGNEQPNPARQPINDAGGTRGPAREPNPEATAQRLFDERQRQDTNVLRATFRRAERAVALFLASLAPGVAERYIRARRMEAEALQARADAEAIQAQERESELERERREWEEAGRGPASNVPNECESAADPPDENGETGVTQGSGPPPLIEI